MAWYVVFRGRNLGIYTDWPSCHAQVDGFKGSTYQKFSTEAQALSAYNSFRMQQGRMMEPAQIPQHRPAADFFCSWKDLIIIVSLLANVVLLYTTMTQLAKK